MSVAGPPVPELHVASDQRKASDMVYEVPASKASIKQNRFEFKIGGKKYDVPKLKYLPGSTVDALAAAEEAGGIRSLAAQYALFGERGTPIGDAVRTLDSEQIEGLMAAWAEESDVSVGESSASTDS